MKLYTPKQVAEMFGVNPQTIRRYEHVYGVTPLRLPSGFRKYTEEHVEQLKKIFKYEK
jgi:DNA-binding transcriptional MerR regulator